MIYFLGEIDNKSEEQNSSWTMVVLITSEMLDRHTSAARVASAVL